MDHQIVVIFCFCDDILRAIQHPEDCQCKMSDAEVLTTSIVAALFFNGNMELTCKFLKEQGYIPKMLEKSRFNRRQHRLADLLGTIFNLIASFWKEHNQHNIYVVDSFPVLVCDNYRIPRSRRYIGEDWRGYQASKKRFVYGLKLHLMVTGNGQPVEFFLTPASWSDTRALRMYQFDLPSKALIIGDKAYNDYELEDLMFDANLNLLPLRKKNSQRALPAWMTLLLSSCRKVIETTGSLFERLLPKHIHAVTARGFELKVALFVLAISFNSF